MVSSIQIAKSMCKFLGVNKSQAKKIIKPVSEEIKSIATGLPKKEKQELYNAFMQLSKNPYNEQAGKVVRSKIAKMKEVQELTAQNANNSLYREYDVVWKKYKYIMGSLEDAAHKRYLDELPNRLTQLMRDSLLNCGAKGIAQTFQPQNVKNIMLESAIKGYDTSNALFLRLLGYPITKTVSLFAPKNIKELCKDTIKLDKYFFGQHFYEKLLKQKNISGRAPERIIINDESHKLRSWEVFTVGKNSQICDGGFNPVKKSIEFTSEFRELPKRVQAGLIAHELKHFEQVDTVIRTFGLEKYIEALKDCKVKNLLQKKVYQGKSEKEIRRIVDEEWDSKGIVQKMKEIYQTSINAPKIEPNSELGKKAAQYLEAQRNYIAPSAENVVLYEPKEYRKNLLEREAYGIQKTVQKWVAVFQNLNFNNL